MLNIDIMLKYIDIPNPKRLEREPDKIISILTNGNTIENGYEIRNIFLRLYIEKIDKEFKLYLDINQISLFDASTEERL